MHSRKSFLLNNNEIWVKKSNPNFQVTMGSFLRAGMGVRWLVFAKHPEK